MEYKSKLHSESGSTKIDYKSQNLGANPGFVEHYQHSSSAKANHHPPVEGKAHTFKMATSREAHGYGHGPGQREGVFRNSGHKGAHMVGKR